VPHTIPPGCKWWFVAVTAWSVIAAAWFVTVTAWSVIAAAWFVTITVRSVIAAMTPPLVPVPVVPVPVPAVVPCPPVSVKVMIVYSVISAWQTVNVVRRHIYNNQRDSRRLNIDPGATVDSSLVPVTFIVSVPIAMVEINSGHVRCHVDVTCSTGNYHNIRGCRLFLRWRRSFSRSLWWCRSGSFSRFRCFRLWCFSLLATYCKSKQKK
jgi:hypothetical protein